MTQGLGWLNEHTLSLSKQRPARGKARKKRGMFTGGPLQVHFSQALDLTRPLSVAMCSLPRRRAPETGRHSH